MHFQTVLTTQVQINYQHKNASSDTEGESIFYLYIGNVDVSEVKCFQVRCLELPV